MHSNFSLFGGILGLVEMFYFVVPIFGSYAEALMKSINTLKFRFSLDILLQYLFCVNFAAFCKDNLNNEIGYMLTEVKYMFYNMFLSY